MTDALRGRRVALVGGAGFIGHNLALALAGRGAAVHVIDSLQVNNLVAIAAKMPELVNRDLYLRICQERLDLMHRAGVELHPVDAREYHMLGHLFTHEIQPQVIVHLAAVAHAGKSNKDPFSTFDHSLRTLENALDHARGNAEHFIYLSSSMVYGNFRTAAVDEDHPLEPLGIYGALKLAGEKIVIAYQQVFSLPYTIIRPSALYGPRCVSRRVGQVFIENALNGSKLQVTGNGSEELDFTYVDDLVDGVLLAIEKTEARNQIFNMTFGRSRKVAEMLEIVLKHFPDAKVDRVERDALMPVRGTLKIDRAARLLGYSPRFPLEVGFPRYIDWYRSLTGGEPPRVR
ncbi:MAG: NAD(P)-dependent oxidoreductase [Planctomycetes bacterium]|nr:NAD(P)-dependent oxidoreductase [Planctomycetota bacterium]